MKLQERRSRFAMELAGGVALIDGDYPNAMFRPIVVP
jgi:hypothetical protein